jgi:hypothetical protein
MSNQNCITIRLHLLGDGISTTVTLVLDSTPMNINTIVNYSPAPDSVTLVQIVDTAGNTVPGEASLSKNGKQVLLTLNNPFSGILTVLLDLGYNV